METQLLELQKDNKKLQKAGEMIKRAYEIAKNEIYAKEQAINQMKDVCKKVMGKLEDGNLKSQLMAL